MKIVNRIVSFCLIIVLTSGAVHAQTKPFVEKSDPDAVKILKKIQKIYSEYAGISLDYTLEMEYGEDKEVQKGSILQQGKKYYINNNGNLIINDGSTVWMYIKKQNEVQINDYIEEEDEDFTPTKIFRMGENDEFVYVVTGEDSEGYRIEFKPRDRDSEIKKVRLLVDRAQKTIKSVKVFSEDGSRMNFLIKDIKNIKPSSNSFMFDKKKYPGVIEIDLRD